jgi:hypothetical protein
MMYVQLRVLTGGMLTRLRANLAILLNGKVTPRRTTAGYTRMMQRI